MKKPALLFTLLLSAAIIYAQEKLGITNSNYSSTNSIFLNPSSSVDSRAYKQFNLVGLNFYTMNNLAYVPKFSVWDTERTGAIQDFEISNIRLKKFLMLVASIEAPAFVLSKRNYGFGVFARARSVGEIKRVPYDLANYLINPDNKQKINYPLNVDLKNIRFSSISWVEFGLNFGYMIRKQKLHMLNLGGNIKYISGINIAFGNIERLKGVIDTTRFETQLQGKLRYNNIAWASGRGFGMDVGITYKKMRDGVDRYYANSPRSNCKYIDYKYKLGISLRDFGFIRFKKNTNTADINSSGVFYTDSSKRSVDYQAELQSNFNTGLNNDPILACLPTAISVQFDWNLGNSFYLNGTIVKNLVPNTVVGVQGSNLLSVCPRFEMKNIELAMPLTFQKFIYPQLGFAFRIRTFVLGLDNLFPLVIKKNTYGVNVYVSLGFSVFRNQTCRKHPRRVDNCAPMGLFKKLKTNGGKSKGVKMNNSKKTKRIRR